MVGPSVVTRMKKLRDFASVRVNAAEIRAFVTIAFRAGKREIVGVISTTMLTGDDVLDVKTQSGELLR